MSSTSTFIPEVTCKCPEHATRVVNTCDTMCHESFGAFLKRTRETDNESSESELRRLWDDLGNRTAPAQEITFECRLCGMRETNVYENST